MYIHEYMYIHAYIYIEGRVAILALVSASTW